MNERNKRNNYLKQECFKGLDRAVYKLCHDIVQDRSSWTSLGRLQPQYRKKRQIPSSVKPTPHIKAGKRRSVPQQPEKVSDELSVN